MANLRDIIQTYTIFNAQIFEPTIKELCSQMKLNVSFYLIISNSVGSYYHKLILWESWTKI